MTKITSKAGRILRLTLLTAAFSAGFFSVQAKQAPAAKKAVTPEPAKSAAVAPTPAPTTTTVHTDSAFAQDPSLTNEKDVFPNGYTNRPSKHEEEKLSIFGRVQVRAMTGQQDTMYSRPGSDYAMGDVNFRRLRLGAIYQGSKNWGALVHLRLENAFGSPATSGSNPLARGLVQEANLWYQWDFMRTRITAGMINQPFAREYQVSSANLVIIERGMVLDALQQFDNGLMLNFNPLKAIDPKLDRFMTIYGMIGTGNGGAGDFGAGRRTDENGAINNSQSTTSAALGCGAAGQPSCAYAPASPFYYGRININPLGGFKRGKKEVGWVEGEEMFLRENKISLGAGIAGTNETHIQNNLRTEYQPRNLQYSNQSGALLATNLNTFAQSTIPLTLSTNTTGTKTAGQCDPGVQCNILAQTYDVKGHLYGFYFDAAFTYVGGNAGQNITGVTGTLGYNFHIKDGMWIMPVVRYDFMKGNFNNTTNVHNNTSGLSSDPANQMTWLWVGVNIFLDKNLAKLQLAYAKSLNNWQGYDVNNSSLSAYKQDMFIAQASYSFWTGTEVTDKPSNRELSGHQP
jgi:hypothetical protein